MSAQALRTRSRFRTIRARLASGIALLLLAGCGGGPATRLQTEDLTQANFQAGLAALRAGDWGKAEQYLSLVRARYPTDLYVILDLGVCWENLGQTEKARAAYRQVAESQLDDIPVSVTDPDLVGRSISDIARRNLDRLDGSH